MEECKDNGAFFFSDEGIGIGGSHSYSHGCAKDLVDFVETVPGVHDANTPIFITWFD